MPETDTSAKNPLHVSEVDDNLKELSPHGSFELPVETYMANCEIFHALYDHWHSEMEIMYIEKGSGFARLNRESIRLKKGDILIVNCGVLHSMRTDLNNPLYYKSVVFGLGFLAGQPGDICQECVVSPLIENKAEFCHHIEEGDSGYEKLREIFLEIHDCHTEKKPYFYVKLKMLFFDFFYEMLTKHYIIPVSTEQNKDSFQTVPAKLNVKWVVHHRRKPCNDLRQAAVGGGGDQQPQPHHGENTEQADDKRVILFLHRFGTLPSLRGHRSPSKEPRQQCRWGVLPPADRSAFH